MLSDTGRGKYQWVLLVKGCLDGLSRINKMMECFLTKKKGGLGEHVDFFRLLFRRVTRHEARALVFGPSLV